MSLEFKKNNYFLDVEKSLLEKSWLKRRSDKRLALNISQKYSLSNFASNLISSRSIKIDDIKRFLEPTLDVYLPDPFIFNDMEKATKRVFKAIKNKEQIAILGDYDVDGLASVVLLKKYLKIFNIDTFTYIPNRITEGYGPNKQAIDKIKNKKNTLLIMVDCGTNSHEIISYTIKKGIDVIIIDHHKSNEKHSNLLSFINPNSIFDRSGYNFLCSTGLTFIFINTLHRLFKSNEPSFENKINLLLFLDLVALATVCDVVPLIDINRAFVFQGLKILSKRHNIGLKTLSDECKLNKKPDEEDLGFFFGPRINAGGRVGSSDIGEKLLNSENENEATLLAKQLNTLNYQRKLIEEKVYEESIEQISKKNTNRDSLLLFKDNWHEGVLGIVASRLKDKYQKPVFILTKNKKLYKGSGRSILGIDIGTLVLNAKRENIIVNGGGHQMAAGISINKKNLKIFEVFLEQFAKKSNKNKENDNNLIIDEAISLNAINDNLIDTINKIGPYGIGNPKPKFLFHNIKIINPKLVGDTKKHLSFIIADENAKSIKAIIFYATDNALGNKILTNYKKNLFSLVGSVKKSIWKNKTYFETIIEDGVLGKVII